MRRWYTAILSRVPGGGFSVLTILTVPRLRRRLIMGLTAGALLSFALVVDMRTLTLRRTFAAIRDAERAPEGRDRRPVAQVVALASGALVAWLGTAVVGLRAAEHRFTATMESITEELGGRYETEHFVILYGARSPDDRTIEIVAAECEFAWARLKRLMGGREPPAKVTAFDTRSISTIAPSHIRCCTTSSRTCSA
jgi:hypothetical protein